MMLLTGFFLGAGCGGGSSTPKPDGGGDTASDVGNATDSDAGGSTGGTGGTGGAGGAAGVGGGGPASAATIFLSSGQENFVYRYSVTASADPQLSTKISVPSPAGLAVAPDGELFVGDYADSKIYRFLSPLGVPTPNGTITTSLSGPEEMRFVDSQLWVVNSDTAGSANPAALIQFGFDSNGNASVAGTLMNSLIGGNRGVTWNATTRDLYVSQCCSTYAIQHFRVAANNTATALPAITGNGLASPHGMVVMPWGEIVVANPGPYPANGGTTLLRFLVDAQGNATANGTITGNGILSPIGLALASWGELFVVNNGGVLSRFTFDSSRAAVANGMFKTAAPYLNWLAVVPGAPTSPAGDGGAMDSGTSDVTLDAASDGSHD
jgi:hypothetical protein